MDKLLPCPFCGGTPILELFNDGFFDYARIRCCRVMFDWCGDETGEQAIAAWNRRVDARQLALKTRVCPMCEDCPDGCPVETPNDSRNKPLTLGELRQMDGEPVWIVTLDGKEESMWEIIVSVGEYGIDLICVLNGVETRDYADFDLYNDTWLAYRSEQKEEV